MSIVTAVYIPEGIVLATDSRLTGTTTHENGTIAKHTLSDNSQKLFLIKDEKIGITCCGDAKIAGKSVGDFIREFEISKLEEKDTIIEVVTKLRDYTISKHGSGVNYYVAGFKDDNQYVYHIINDSITKKNGTDEILFGATWDGEVDAVSKLINCEPKMQFDFNLMQLKDGIDFAEFIIDTTIKYHRFDIRLATCGGSIDILVITKDYTKWVKHKVLNP